MAQVGLSLAGVVGGSMGLVTALVKRGRTKKATRGVDDLLVEYRKVLQQLQAEQGGGGAGGLAQQQYIQQQYMQQQSARSS